MLVSLHVKNFAIIDEVWLDFGKGFNVLTGETGAGKSILIGSLGAVLGGKVTKDMLGNRANYALVELVFESDSPEIKRILEENELGVDEQVIISRKISENGRSVLRINGEVVTQNVVKELASNLIDIHGQHEHQSLLYKSAQRKIVDSFSEAAGKLLQDIKVVYRDYKKAVEEYEVASTSGRKSQRELDLIRYELDEIEAAALKEGEDIELEERFKVLSNTDKISSLLSVAVASLVDERNSVSDQLDVALKALGKVSGIDEKLSNMFDILNTVSDEIGDLCADIKEYAEDISGTEEEFANVNARLDVINRLKTKYGSSIEAIKEYADECNKKLEEYDDYDAFIDGLKKKIELHRSKLDELCAKLSKIREKISKDLSLKVTKALQELNFEYATFEIKMLPLEEPGENGAEEIEFYISTNMGSPLKKLAQSASGGELSRVMLAIKSVIAGNNTIDALIFDEIDTGISGRTAQKVSEKISELSGSHQVICITHLPQIASMADTHFLIEKSQNDGTTTTSISELDTEGQVSELARMLGGTEITDSVIANAREMKKLADNWKKA